MDTKAAAAVPGPDWFKIIVALPMLIALLWFGQGFLKPLAITALIYILAMAFVDRLCRVPIAGRTLPVWLASIAAVLIAIACLWFFGLVFANSSDEIAEALPRYAERLQVIALELEAVFGAEAIDPIRQTVAGLDIGSFLAILLNELSGNVTTIALIALYLGFLISERSTWTRKLPRLSSTEQGAVELNRLFSRISTGVKQYMWVNAVTSAMSGAVAYLVFVSIGLDFAELLAVIVFIVGFIPNIGAFIGVFLPSMVALLQFDSYVPFLIVFIVYGGSDQFIANVIMPMMQGKSLNMSTFMVMVALAFWALMWGGLGAFLAMPLTVMTMVICAEMPSMRWVAVLLSSDGILDGSERSD
ncbi:AI-2E family transporter [Pseudoruegeria sp. HB172150]|uniref:AI-2E family transporter n=1 Tax=Pseudoruegeria sp. HB172150 TaxID=2721164 RepID=UPI001555332F|nr:AI-2E family transporter [Pseudoruegeria sp. HB172150]